MISACLWVLGSRAWTFFMSRAYGGEGRGCSTVQQDSSDAGTGGAGEEVNPIPTRGSGGGIFCPLFTSDITKQNMYI